MIIYFITFIILVILSEVIRLNSRSSIYFWGIGILTVVSGFRSKFVGTDTYTYTKMFRTKIFDVEVEIGFKKWIDFISLVSNETEIFILLTSFLQLFVLFYFLTKTSKNVALSLLLFTGLGYLFFYLSGMRQAIALSFFVGSIYYFVRNKKGFSLVFFILAGLFHSTVFIFLPICLVLNKINLTKKAISIAIIISVLIAWIEALNIESLLGSLGIYDLFMGQGVLDRYKGYSEYTVELNLSRTISSKIRSIILPSVLVFLVNKYSTQKHDLFTKLYILGIIITNVLSTFPLGFRIGLYGTIFQLIVIPNFISNIKSNVLWYRYLYLYALIVISFGIKNAYEGISNYRRDIVPYVFFWE